MIPEETPAETRDPELCLRIFHFAKGQRIFCISVFREADPAVVTGDEAVFFHMKEIPPKRGTGEIELFAEGTHTALPPVLIEQIQNLPSSLVVIHDTVPPVIMYKNVNGFEQLRTIIA